MNASRSTIALFSILVVGVLLLSSTFEGFSFGYSKGSISSAPSVSSNTYKYPNFVLGGAPEYLAYNPSNNYMYVVSVYVAAPGGNTVYVVKGTTCDIVEKIPLPNALRLAGIAYDPADGQMYVADAAANTIYVLSATSLVETVHNPSFKGPWGVAFDPATNTIWITNRDSKLISIMSGDKVIKTVTGIYDQTGAAYFPISGGLMYVTSSIHAKTPGIISVLSASTYKLVAKITVGRYPFGIAFDQSNNLMYIGNDYSGSVSVLSQTCLCVVSTITAKDHPFSVAYSASDSEIYVVDDTANIIRVVGDYSVVSSISLPLGFDASVAAYNPSNNAMYVTGFGSGNLTIIPT